MLQCGVRCGISQAKSSWLMKQLSGRLQSRLQTSGTEWSFLPKQRPRGSQLSFHQILVVCLPSRPALEMHIFPVSSVSPGWCHLLCELWDADTSWITLMLCINLASWRNQSIRLIGCRALVPGGCLESRKLEHIWSALISNKEKN